ATISCAFYTQLSLLTKNPERESRPGLNSYLLRLNNREASAVAARDGQQNGFSLGLRHQPLEILDIVDRFAIDSGDDHPAADRIRCRTGGIDAVHDHAVRCRGHPDLLGQIRSEVLYGDAAHRRVSRAVVAPRFIAAIPGFVPIHPAGPRTESNFHSSRLIVPSHIQRHCAARYMGNHVHREVVGTFHLLSIDGRNHVALLQAGLRAWAVWRHVGDQGALRALYPEVLRKLWSQSLQ